MPTSRAPRLRVGPRSDLYLELQARPLRPVHRPVNKRAMLFDAIEDSLDLHPVPCFRDSWWCATPLSQSPERGAFFLHELLLSVLWSLWARGARVGAGGGQRALSSHRTSPPHASALSTGCPHAPKGSRRSPSGDSSTNPQDPTTLHQRQPPPPSPLSLPTDSAEEPYSRLASSITSMTRFLRRSRSSVARYGSSASPSRNRRPGISTWTP